MKPSSQPPDVSPSASAHEASPPVDGTPAPSSVASPAPLPWYRSPALWPSLLGIMLVLCCLWLIWFQWTNYQQRSAQVNLELQELRARRALWQAEADRLRAGLTEDPCLAAQSLQRSPVLPPVLVPSPTDTPPSSTDTPPSPVTDPPATTENTQTFTPPANTSPAQPEQDTQKAPPATMADMMEQATVLVLAQGKKGISMGTGFFIDPGFILTNQHVVGTNPQHIWVINKATRGITDATLTAASNTKGQDYAVLKLPPVAGVQPLTFAPTVQRTDRVSAWGFPNAVTADDPQFQALLSGKGNTSPEVVYTDGVVSVILNRKPPLIVHTATVSQGNSGGPLVNAQGQVVGINTYIRLDEESYRQSSLAIMNPDVLQFLKSHNIPFTLSAPATTPAAPAAQPAAGTKKD